jgi:protein SCO1
MREAAPNRRLGATIIAIMLIAIPTAARAELTENTLLSVGAKPAANARIPMDLAFLSDDGLTTTLKEVMDDRPTVLVLADYTCTTLCGPLVVSVAGALARSNLPANRFRFVVVGLDPKDGVAEAQTMKRAQLGTDTRLLAASQFLVGPKAAIDQLAESLSYSYAYDAAADQFAHSAAIFVLTPDGRVARVLSGLGATADDIDLALIEAAQGAIGTWRDQVRLICYGFDPARGAYTLTIHRILMVSAGATVLAMGGGIAMLAIISCRRTMSAG